MRLGTRKGMNRLDLMLPVAEREAIRPLLLLAEVNFVLRFISPFPLFFDDEYRRKYKSFTWPTVSKLPHRPPLVLKGRDLR